MLPSPEQIRAFLDLGLPGAFVVALVAFALDYIRSGRAVDKQLAKIEADRAIERARDERVEARLVAERDTAIALAQSYGDQFERALDIIEAKAGKPA